MTASETILNVVVVSKTSACITPADGQKLYKAIELALENSDVVTVSFLGVKFLISAYLNTALGQLYSGHTAETLNRRLKITDATNEQLSLIREVLTNAKTYYADPERMDSLRREAMNEA